MREKWGKRKEKDRDREQQRERERECMLEDETN